MTRRVLLVDGGNPAMGRLLFEYFHRGHDYEVESVEYCDDAVTALLHRPFDLVLLLSIFSRWKTWPRARFSGIEMLKQMRALHIPVPVLVVSQSILAEAKEEAVANGAFAFIPAPINLADLDRLVALALAG